jgi:hypothetical protein
MPAWFCYVIINVLYMKSISRTDVEVKLLPTVSRPVYLCVRRLSGTRDQFYFPHEIFFRHMGICYFVAPFLTRGLVCNLLYNCFWALPEQSLLSWSPAELTTIFFCLIWDSPNLEGQVPVFVSKVKVTLRQTVCRPVRLGVLPLLEQVTRCYIYLSENYFLYFSCRAPSLTRGRFRNLQCNDASSFSNYLAIDGLSARPSWCRAPILLEIFF